MKFSTACVLAMNVGVVACYWPSLVTAASAAQHAPHAGTTGADGTRGGSPVTEVFIVPHSHCDAGWILTPPEYYEYEVRHILDTVTTALAEDANLRFNWAETLWLDTWFRDARYADRARQFRALVAQGRVDIAGGGWVQNDEATADYMSVVDQMTLGLRWLREHANRSDAPASSWQIDPFGAAATTPRLFQQMGIRHHVIDRIPPAEHAARQQSRAVEFMWTPSASTDDSILTHVIGEGMLYMSPSGCDWEGLQNNSFPDSPITASNIGSRAAALAQELRRRAAHFRTPNLLVPFGGDFHFQRASVQFGNMSKLIAYINANSTQFGVRLRYATLSDYVSAVRGANMTWPTRGRQDFLPYRFVPYIGHWWSGYYTSRPVSKGLIRALDRRLRAAETTFAMADVLGSTGSSRPAMLDALKAARQASATLNHHDAVTGTARARVVEWYEELARNATAQATRVMANSVASISGAPLHTAGQNTVVELATDTALPIALVDVMGRSRNLPFLTIQSAETDIAVVDATGEPLLCQVLPAASGTAEVVVAVPPALLPNAGYTTVFAVASAAVPAGRACAASEVIPRNGSSSPWINVSYGGVEVRFNGSSGALATMTAIDGVTAKVAQQYATYTSNNGNAYEIGVEGSAVPLSTSGISVSVVRGPLLTEIRRTFACRWLSDAARVFNTSAWSSAIPAAFVDVTVAAGPLPPDVDLVSRFSSDLTPANQSWFTDDSGLELQRRTYNPSVSTGQNYVPAVRTAFVNGTVATAGQGAQLAVLSQQTHGTTLADGRSLEVMLHRRMSQYDILNGLMEVMNDTSVLSDTVRVVMSGSSAAADARHALADELNAPLVTATMAAVADHEIGGIYCKTRRCAAQVLREPLPGGVQLLSFMTSDPGAVGNVSTPSTMAAPVMLRLNHVFESGDASASATPETLKVAAMWDQAFANRSVVMPTTLAMAAAPSAEAPVGNITLHPMEFASFLVDFGSHP